MRTVYLKGLLLVHKLFIITACIQLGLHSSFYFSWSLFDGIFIQSVNVYRSFVWKVKKSKLSLCQSFSAFSTQLRSQLVLYDRKNRIHFGLKVWSGCVRILSFFSYSRKICSTDLLDLHKVRPSAFPQVCTKEWFLCSRLICSIVFFSFNMF